MLTIIRHIGIFFEVVKNKENIDPKELKKLIVEQCYHQNVVSGSKNSRFIKEQEEKGTLSSLDLRTPFRKIALLGDILF